MNSIFKKVSLGTALVVTAASALIATPVAAQGWRGGDYRHGGDGAGVAIAAGIVGLAVGAALADHGPEYGRPEPVGYAPYGGPADCYQAYSGYDNTCYPVEDYYRMGWSWRDGSWWSRDGQRYARPFMGRGGPGGGYAGGYGGGHGRDQRGGYRGGNYAGGGMQGDHGGGRGPGNGGGYAGGHGQDGGHGGYGGEGGGRGDGGGRGPGGGGEHR